MSVIYLTYANDRNHPLHSLQEEEQEINRILADRKLNNHFLLERDPYASLDNIRFHLNRFHDRLVFFGFSGHAGGNHLSLEAEIAHANGIGHMLGQCPNLKMVLLNGCSTAGQVKGLLEKGVRVVIHTRARVGDRTAKDFAIALFEALNRGRTIGEAYEHAKGAVMARDNSKVFTEGDRGFKWGAQPGVSFPWGIRYREAADLNWTLPDGADVPELHTPLQESAAGKTQRLFFICDKPTRTIYSKIKNSFHREIQEGNILLNDVFGVSDNLNRESVIGEIGAADLVVFLVNGLDFLELWNRMPWTLEALRMTEKPVVFIKVKTESSILNTVGDALSVPYHTIPRYEDLLAFLPQGEVDRAITNEIKPGLQEKLEEIKRGRILSEDRLRVELEEFDLTTQKEAFNGFLENSGLFNLVLVEGSEKCAQDLLLQKLTGYLDNSGSIQRIKIPFRDNQEEITVESQLWARMAHELQAPGLANPQQLCPILWSRLIQQEVIIVLDNVFEASHDSAQAEQNLSLLSNFWRTLTQQLSSLNTEILHPLFLFGINRGHHCDYTFDTLQILNEAPESRILHLPPIERVPHGVLTGWHREKRRRFTEPEFHELLEHQDEILATGFLADVLRQICEKLNCPGVYHQLLIQ